jgi:16S rRNA (adenine1518-N6/adenine1519-N6)-dimethyltransferase
MGVLTKYLLNKPVTTYVIEIDTESVTYLDENHPKLKDKIISRFFWGTILMKFWGKQFAIIGNLYNISTQIVLEH